MKIHFRFSFWLTCRPELKCSARIYRGLKDKCIFALYSAEILNPVWNTVPQERWSAVTPVKRKQKRRKDQRPRKHNPCPTKEKGRNRFKYIKGHWKKNGDNLHKILTDFWICQESFMLGIRKSILPLKYQSWTSDWKGCGLLKEKDKNLWGETQVQWCHFCMSINANPMSLH